MCLELGIIAHLEATGQLQDRLSLVLSLVHGEDITKNSELNNKAINFL